MAYRWRTLMMILAGMLFTFPNTDGGTVLLLSMPHAANVRTHTNVGRALAKMGHNAYVLIPKFMLDDNIVDVGGIHVVSYGDYLGNVDAALTSEMLNSFWMHERTGVKEFVSFVQTVGDIVYQILSDACLIAKLRDIRPDLILLTCSPAFKNIVILPYMLNVPFAFMSPYYDVFANRILFSMSSTPCQSGAFDLDSIINRMKNIMCHTAVLALDYVLANDSMVAEFAPNMPETTVNELSRQAVIFLVESDHILDFPKPELPNTKVIGCTAPRPGKPLQEPFKTFMANVENGVAVVTFGSSIVNIPENISRVMLAAFERQDLHVIWRVNYTSPNPKKILTSVWIPQNDILAHYKTKLFVSHCGAHGQYEALYHGVPLLCLPIVGDQFYNAHRSTTKGFGLDASIIEISEIQLASLMKEVAGNETYAQTIKNASAMFKHIYKDPVQSAAFWIDYVLKWKGLYMRSYGLDMPLYKFLCLDVIGILLAISAVAVFISLRVCRCYCRLLCKLLLRKRKEKKPKTQ